MIPSPPPLSFPFSLEHPHQYPFHVKEETIDSSSVLHQTFPMPLLPSSMSLLADSFASSGNILTSPPMSATGNRRASARQQKRRSLREPNSAKDSSGSAKKKTKFDNGSALNADIGGDSNFNRDSTATRSNSTEQQQSENASGKPNSSSLVPRCHPVIRCVGKRYRPGGRRGGKRFANQPGASLRHRRTDTSPPACLLEYENEDYRSSSPSNVTMRQQLKEMFKHRPSRYNFLDLSKHERRRRRVLSFRPPCVRR